MRKCQKWQVLGLLFCALRSVFACGQTPAASDASHAFSTPLLERAEHKFARIKALVDEGALPKTRLLEAQVAHSDGQDDAILPETLYGPTRLQRSRRIRRRRW